MRWWRLTGLSGSRITGFQYDAGFPQVVCQIASKRGTVRLGSDLARVDAHVVQPHEYDELPELTDEIFAQAKLNKGGRPRSPNPKRLISLRLPQSVIDRWRNTGPGWQTRMAERLSKAPAPRAKRAQSRK